MQIQKAWDILSFYLYTFLSLLFFLSVSTVLSLCLYLSISLPFYLISLPFYLSQGGHATLCGISVTAESPPEKSDWSNTQCCILPLLPRWHHQTYRAPVQELCLKANVQIVKHVSYDYFDKNNLLKYIL